MNHEKQPSMKKLQHFIK